MFEDRLDPRARTWISLEPIEPRLRAMLERGYRELLEANRYLGNEAEIAKCLAELAKIGATP